MPETASPADPQAPAAESAAARRCVVCGGSHDATSVERATVASNLRAFADERHGVWRCPTCASIHAAGDVDLAAYYAGYPMHTGALTGWHRAVYGEQLRRLRAAGLPDGARVLDHGCGAGLLVALLRERGLDAHGYDAWNPAFADEAVLGSRYDAVVSQDVLEHVDDPLATLDALGALVHPGGLVAIGTPAAEHIDLGRPERFRHALHQPWHRHILSTPALIEAGRARGWSVVAHHRCQYLNTWTPTANVAWLGVVIATSDGTLDALFEPPTWKLWALLPLVWPVALLGRLVAPPTDGMVIFRT